MSRDVSRRLAWGQKLDKTAQDHLKAIAVQNSIEREANQNRKYEHNAHRAEQAYNLMPDATPEQGYLAAKGVKPFPGAKMDKQGRLVLPLRNENGDVRTLQRISESGFKSLKKNGQKTRNYHVVGEQELGRVDLCCTFRDQQYIGNHINMNASDNMLA